MSLLGLNPPKKYKTYTSTIFDETDNHGKLENKLICCLLIFSHSIYHKLKLCVDNLAIASSCEGHGSLDDFFLKVHNMYFSSCGQVRDPPLTIVILLIGPLTLLTLVLPHLCVFLTTKNTEISCSLGLNAQQQTG